MKIASSRPAKGRAIAKTSQQSTYLRSPQLRLEAGEQVAAVCYRVRGNGIEFLLVQSRGGRWIFPKGSIESGLTHAQSAALEALEEAGVHGRIEENSFARYVRRERGGKRSAAKSGGGGVLVHTYLCEVRRLDRPQESNRNRTWFTGEKAKRRLREDRAEDFGADLAHVVDRALSRIQRLHSSDRNTPDRMHRDALHKVRFEAFEDTRFRGDFRKTAISRYSFRHVLDARWPAIIKAGASEDTRRPLLRLGTGLGSLVETVASITSIDKGRRGDPSKSGAFPPSKHKVPGKLARDRTSRSSN